MTGFKFKSNLTSDSLGQSISRRDLLRRALVGTAALPFGTALLAACGDSDNEPDAGAEPDGFDDEQVDSASEGEDAGDTTTRRGGTIRIGVAGSVDTFDPHHPLQFEGIWAQSMLYSRLLRLDHELEFVPDLAVSWDSNEDGSQWTFQLRDDVQFHNGRPFTAEDVKRSFDRIIDPEEGTVVAGEVTMLEGTEVIDDYEVACNLTSPYADFISLMGMYFMRIVDVDSADTLDTDPMGTGPYVLGSHSAGERTTLERFEDYYDTENQAFLDAIEYITISEDTARLTSLTGGTIDLVSEVPPASIPLVQDVPGVIVDDVETGSYLPICMRVDEPPFDDVRVRQAMKLVIDRDQYLNAVFQGLGTPCADHPVPPYDPMNAGLPIPERNIEEASRLLADAGYPDAVDVTLHASAGRPGMQESAITFQEMAQDAGIRVQVESHPIDSYWSEIYQQRPFFMSSWSSRPVADQAMAVAHFEDSGWNETGWHSDELEDLVVTARATMDEDERLELLGEAQEIIATEGASIIPFFISMTGAWSERVQGFHMHPLKWIDMHTVWIDGEA